MSLKNSAKDVVLALRLDSHHAIERFGVFFGVVVVAFVLLFGGASVSAVTNQSQKLDSTPLYTPTFSTSKTQISGEVSGVYVNSDRTRAMVLMHFQDSSSISSNAAKYQAFITGSARDLSTEAMKNKVTGEVVVFGTTGYMAMVLNSDKPFQQQVLSLTMRANSELVYLPEDSRKVRDDLKGQTSFSKYDQWRLFFNPGASGVKTTSSLDGNQFNAGAVYAALVIAPQEQVVRAALDQQLGQMMADQARISEFTTDMGRVKVDGLSIVPPKVPTQIAGDSITGAPAVAGTSTASSLMLKTDWVSPSGFNFDWRSGSVAKGYLDSLVPAGGSYVRFLADKAALSQNGDQGSLQVDKLKWKLSDGTDLGADYADSDQTMKQLFDIRNGLSQAYQDYYKDKIAYQVGAYGNLINLEVDLRNVRAGSSINDTAKALVSY